MLIGPVFLCLSFAVLFCLDKQLILVFGHTHLETSCFCPTEVPKGRFGSSGSSICHKGFLILLNHAEHVGSYLPLVRYTLVDADAPPPPGLQPRGIDHDTMALSEQQILAISATERVCSTISLVGTFVIVATFIWSPLFRKPINRLVFYASWGNIMANIATIISADGIHIGVDSSLCQFQGFLIQWSVLILGVLTATKNQA